jgi:EAL and modified HD-GYP domain-containing signal transduction protein
MQDSPLFGQVHLGYAPVVDHRRDIAGVQLTLVPARADVQPDAAELLRVLCAAFEPLEPTKSDAPLSLLLNIASESLLDRLLSLQPPAYFGVEVPTFMTSDPARADHFRALHSQGVSLVAKGRTVSAMQPPLMGCFKALIVDAADEDLGIDRPINLGPRPLLTYIDGTRTASEVELAFSSGAQAVIGWPLDEFSPPPKGGVAPDLRAIIDLMNLIDRQDSIDRMERVLKSDPTLAFRLLRFINSSAFGLRVEVTSFRHALMLLGHLRLKRWLALLLASAIKDAASRPLLHLAVRRGFMMEELAVAAGQEDLRGEMFICGVFSLLDKMMRQPFEDLLEHVPMPSRVQVSLLGDGGPYTPHLRLMAALEQSSFVEVREAADKLQVSPAEVNRVLMSALISARELEV